MLKIDLAAAAAVLWATIAIAAAPTGVIKGATVYDGTGAVVGTIDSVTETAAVVSTGSTRVTLGFGSFAPSDKGPVIGMTRAQLEAAAANALAQGSADVKALLSVGAVVYGTDGAQAATVESFDEQNATLAVGTSKARLPLSAFSKGAMGLEIAMNAAELRAAVAAQTQQPAPATPPSQ